MSNIEAVGGWIADAERLPAGSYLRLHDISRKKMNRGRMAYFHDYRTRYFYERFIFGQGAENILEAFSARPEKNIRWIDIGAGVTTLFWSIGLDGIKRVEVCDVIPEALQILFDFKQSTEVPLCYKEAMALCDKNVEHLKKVRKLKWKFHIFDALVPWPVKMQKDNFDLISAIGCLGLSSSQENYAIAFKSLVDHLSPGGRIVGADWVRSRSFVEKEGHDNRYINMDMIRGCASKNKLKKLYEAQIEISGDPNYELVFVWSYCYQQYQKNDRYAS